MDVLFFLKERARFIRYYYKTAAEPFRETIRKIEADEAPFDDPTYSEDDEPAWSKNSCSYLIVAYEQGAGPFPASNGHVTWILMRLLSTSSVPRNCGKCEVP